MADIVKSREDMAVLIGEFLNEHKGKDVIVLDIKEHNSWTDYMILATSSSTAHLKGLVRQLKDLLYSENIELLRRHKQIADDGWELMDLGNYVIHLMNRDMREFYNLEKLWFQGKIIYHSSKSS